MTDKKQIMLDELSKEPEMVIATAYLYAKNYVHYGEDVTKAWATALQQNAILEKAYNNGYSDALKEREERKAGKWEYKQLDFREYGVVCSSCGYAMYIGYDFTSMEEFKDMVKRKLQDPHITMDKYCCKCGSRNER